MSRRARLGGGDLLPMGMLSSEKMALIRRRLEEQGLSDNVRPAIPRVEHDGPAPLAFSQEALWFIDRVDPGKATYNIPCAVRLTGALDVAALQRSLDEIVRRHDVLRAIVVEGPDGVPGQEVLPPSGFRLPIEDMTDLSDEDRDHEVRRRAMEYGQAPFDLTRGPLFAAALLRIAADEHVLVMRIHQLVTDGWSFGVFTRELGTNYEAFLRGGPPPLAPLPIQFSDYAVWQRQWVEQGGLDEQLAYWKAHLSGAPRSLELPADRPRPAGGLRTKRRHRPFPLAHRRRRASP